ncbi:MAG: Ig-like domain-containing protein [Desulfobacterales bacterium]|nr:Ig-like domain-containing protein [Desulfobacterales bacterium]
MNPLCRQHKFRGIGIILMCLFFLSCGASGGEDSSSAGDGNGGTTTTNISVSASSQNIVADGTSQTSITATVTDSSGAAVADGTQVTFSTTTGNLSAASATTTSGVATVTLTSPLTTGIATVTASSGGASDTVTITLVAAQVGSISLAAGSSSLPADNASTTLITATVRDPSGNPVSDGTAVTFTTTAGSLSAASADTSGGTASVILTSSAILGSALIDATSGGVSSTTSVTFVAGPPAAVSVSASPNNLTADGASTSLLTALVADSGDNPVNGESVSFAATSGSLSNSSVQTDITGTARVTFTAPIAVGTGAATVTAATSNNISNTAAITLVSAQVGSIAMAISNTSIPADGSSTTLIAVTVKDVNGNDITDGTTVNFTATSGTLSAAGADTSGGNASVILTSPTTVGPSLVTATSGGASSSGTVSFTAGSADSANTTLSANPGVIPADGASTSLVTLAAADANGNPVVDGTSVSFTTTEGSLSSETASTTNGRASVNLTSSTSNETAAVTAVIDTVTKTVSVVFGTGAGSGEPANIIVSVAPETIQVQGTGGVSRTTVTATVVDENGEPYNDSSDNIRFTIQSGLSGGEYLVDDDGNPQPAITKGTSGGIAAVSLQAGTISGPVTILVEVLKDGAGTLLGTSTTAVSPPILIEPGAPFSMTLFRASAVIDNANGALSQIFAAMLQDRQGNPVADGTGVYFGIVDNPPNGYLVNGSDGNTILGSDLFISSSTAFDNSVEKLDRVIILSGPNEGGHIIIETVETGSVNSVRLFNDYLKTDNTNTIVFVAGNAQLGTICTVVPTGNLIPDTTCTPATGTSVKGVAHSRLTWTGADIFKPFYLYAQSADSGINLGQALSSTYGFFEPAIIDVSLVPASSVAGGTPVTVSAHLHDSASPSNDLSNQTLDFAINNTTVAGFGAIGNGTTTSVTNQNGIAQTSLVTNAVAATVNVTVSYTAATGETYTGTATLTLN